MDTMAVVDQTWKELGRRFRAVRQVVFVRTDPPKEKVGSIYKPYSRLGFYDGMPNQHPIAAVVISAGPDTEFKTGDRICFQRLFFARLTELSDHSLVGWILGPNVSGFLEGDLDDSLVPNWTKVPEVVKNIREMR